MNIPILKRISLTKDFKRDMNKLPANILTSPEYIEVFHCLLYGKSLPEKYRDHALHNNMKGYRDCHIFNDLVLVYKIEEDILHLARINTHSEIFK